MENSGLVKIYTVGDKIYGYYPNWEDSNGKPRAEKSKCPPPTSVNICKPLRTDVPDLDTDLDTDLDLAAAPKRPRLVKVPKEPNPGIKTVIDAYHDAFKTRFGSAPPINGKTGKVAGQLLSGRSVEEAVWIVKQFMEAPPPWYYQKSLWGIEHILSAATSLLAEKGNR